MNAPSTGVAGVTTSLWVAGGSGPPWSRRENVAGTPSTATEVTVSPSRSRPNDERGEPVVAAVIVVVASMRPEVSGRPGVQTMSTS